AYPSASPIGLLGSTPGRCASSHWWNRPRIGTARSCRIWRRCASLKSLACLAVQRGSPDGRYLCYSGGNPMTEQEIAGLGPAFAAYLGRYRDCFLQKRTAAHLDIYCRGLLSDLPRKTVEPIALDAGTAVRTLQEFLVTARWDHWRMRDLLQ